MGNSNGASTSYWRQHTVHAVRRVGSKTYQKKQKLHIYRIITSLKTHCVSAEQAAKGDICSICRELVKEGETVRELTCGHKNLHAHCIDPWLRQNGQCPNCRRTVDVPRKSEAKKRLNVEKLQNINEDHFQSEDSCHGEFREGAHENRTFSADLQDAHHMEITLQKCLGNTTRDDAGCYNCW